VRLRRCRARPRCARALRHRGLARATPRRAAPPWSCVRPSSSTGAPPRNRAPDWPPGRQLVGFGLRLVEIGSRLIQVRRRLIGLLSLLVGCARQRRRIVASVVALPRGHRRVASARASCRGAGRRLNWVAGRAGEGQPGEPADWSVSWICTVGTVPIAAGEARRPAAWRRFRRWYERCRAVAVCGGRRDSARRRIASGEIAWGFTLLPVRTAAGLTSRVALTGGGLPREVGPEPVGSTT
jgi:hypothetical protein